MNRAFIPLLLFLQRKNMKLCPKTAPAPMAQRDGAGFPKARVRALGVPGRGRKFKSWNADHNRGCPNGTSPIIFCVAGYAEIAEKAKAFSKRACARQVSSLVTQTSRSGMNRAFIPLLLFLQRKNMKLCPKTAPAPMAQRDGAGFPKARVRALGVPGRGRKFKSWNADHNRGCPNGTSPIIFCVAGYAEIAEKAKAFSKRACARQVSSLVAQAKFPAA